MAMMTDETEVWLTARAREEGQRAGRVGVAADQNPWREKMPEFTRGYTSYSNDRPHAVRYTSKYGAASMCGKKLVLTFDFKFPYPGADDNCKTCIRAVEAEMKRRATAWESGRLSTHPK